MVILKPLPEPVTESMSQAKVTITDIAKRAGVSKTTVSRVLNDKPDVDKETREQVLAIIRETGFVPQTQAVNLVKGRTGLIGLLVPSLTNPYSLTVIQGVAEALAETDYEMILYTTSMASKNQELFVKRLTRNLTDGLLILLPRNFREYEDRLIKSQFPVVLIDHRGLSSDFPSITASNRKGAFEAVRYLIGLGHGRIGFVSGLMDFGCSRERLEGYRDALSEAGIPYEDGLVRYGDFTEASGYHCCRELLECSRKPSAVFCSNDDMALGAMQAARDMGAEVPRDVSIVGFDDGPKASFSSPQLTTVRQPLQAMGRRAAEILLRRIEGEVPRDKEVVLETELVIRGTCGRAKS